MGFGFAILLHLVGLLILSAVIGFFAAIITYFTTTPPKKKRKVFLAAFVPLQGLMTLYILALVGTVIVSEIKKVDIGIGDCWYVPLNDSCRLLFIDSFEQAYIECNEESLMDGVASLQQQDERIFGITDEGKYFALNLKNKQIIEYASQTGLIDAQHVKSLDLVSAADFYDKRKSEVAGTLTMIAFFISLLITVLIVIVFCRLVLYGWKLGFNKQPDH
jgi:hypothetical protein